MIQRLTREQLCQGILAGIDELVSQVPAHQQHHMPCCYMVVVKLEAFEEATPCISATGSRRITC